MEDERRSVSFGSWSCANTPLQYNTTFEDRFETRILTRSIMFLSSFRLSFQKLKVIPREVACTDFLEFRTLLIFPKAGFR